MTRIEAFLLLSSVLLILGGIAAVLTAVAIAVTSYTDPLAGQLANVGAGAFVLGVVLLLAYASIGTYWGVPVDG